MSNPIQFNHDRALELLRLATGIPGAQFRDGQEEAIREIVEGSKRLVVVQKTGWGKSFVYFIATKLLREAGLGPTLLISPLLSLMRNQIDAARKMGLIAVRLDSSNPDDEKSIERSFVENGIDILLITEMRLAKPRFQTHVLGRASVSPSLLVIDEVHCISDWGHDFRPLYRRIDAFIRNSPASLRVLGTTATANNRVLEDIQHVFGEAVVIQRGEIARNNLVLQTIVLPDHASRLAWLASNIPTIQGSGIIYSLTIADAEVVARWLKLNGVTAHAYHAALTNEARSQLERDLILNNVKALVATTALGMGFDKPDLTFVVHYQTPGSVIAYYQQVGRAGRSVVRANGVLLGGPGDSDILDYFRNNAFPARENVEAILRSLSASPTGLSVSQIESTVNIQAKKIERALELISLEPMAPVVRDDTIWSRTASPLDESFWERAGRVSAVRAHEQEQMQEYLQLSGGHMKFLVAALDGDVRTVAPELGLEISEDIDISYVKKAVEFLRRTSIPIYPRKRLPGSGVPRLHPGTMLPAEWQVSEGRALSYWGDSGWGGMVRRGKYELNVFEPELVTAMAEMVKDWGPEPRPTWVTSIPSFRHPTLVSTFAKALAAILGIEFREAVLIAEKRDQQKLQENGYHQAQNAAAAFKIDKNLVLEGSCLLVDDVVNSRWTFTVAGKLLREAGAGVVRPIALSMVNGGDSE